MTPLLPVFVYGTLRPGERNAHVAARGGSFTARPATLAGFRLFHLRPEGYPGIVPGAASDLVYGAALTYAPADWEQALTLLDALEGVDETPPLYTRQRVRLTLEGGAVGSGPLGSREEVEGWVYVYACAGRLSQSGVTPLPGGDWCALSGR